MMDNCHSHSFVTMMDNRHSHSFVTCTHSHHRRRSLVMHRSIHSAMKDIGVDRWTMMTMMIIMVLVMVIIDEHPSTVISAFDSFLMCVIVMVDARPFQFVASSLSHYPH